MVPIITANLATVAAGCHISQQQRSMLSSKYGTIPLGDRPETCWLAECIGPFPPWKRQHVVLTGANTHSGYGFSFPVCNSSTKIAICGLTKCLIHCHDFLHILTSDQGTHFTARECDSGPTLTKSAGITMFPSTLKHLA